MRGDLDEPVASRTLRRRLQGPPPLVAERERADVVRLPGRDRQLRRVALLAVHELGQEPQRRLLQQRVELRQLRAC